MKLHTIMIIISPGLLRPIIICIHLPCQLNMEYTCSLFQVKSTVNDETDHLPTEKCARLLVLLLAVWR